MSVTRLFREGVIARGEKVLMYRRAGGPEVKGYEGSRGAWVLWVA